MHEVLIDTWWNVNNILNLRFQCIKAVLIDTWWNVNENTIVQEIDLSIVLIDTWWNANLEEERWKSTGVTVLIDTWWNVNDGIQGIYPACNPCFNRYMVECESNIGHYDFKSQYPVLIDTWWNVNELDAFRFATYAAF